MKNRICSVDNCDTPRRSKGFCDRHYKRFKLYGNALTFKNISPKERPLSCSVENCNAPYFQKGFCSKHLYRYRHYGNPTYKATKHCSIENCNLPYKAKGYCQVHYSSYNYSGEPVRSNEQVRSKKEFTPLSFWSKIAITANLEKCWIWQGRREPKGYGRFNLVTETVKFQLAHRVAYYLFHGKDPKELFVCHRCDNPICCNPHHFFLGTHEDNQRDKIAKNRHRKNLPTNLLFI